MAGCYERPTGPCSRREMPGTVNLYQFVLKAHAGVLAGNGIYNCRPPRGAASGFSAHAEGRALDVNAAMANGKPNPAPIPRGSPADVAIRTLADLFVIHAGALGVQRMIYQEREWRCDRGWFTPSSGLQKLHANHWHTEQTRAKANTLTTAEIVAALTEDDDMFTEADRDRAIRIEQRLEELFGVDAAGHAVDIRAKIDAIYIDTHGEDHRDLLAGRVAAIDETVNGPLSIDPAPAPRTG